MLEDFWRKSRPDMVVSLVPNLESRARREPARKHCPECRWSRIITDIADYPPHFWIEQQEQHFICGSAKAR